MYVPARSREAVIAEATRRVLKDARIQRAFARSGIRDAAGVVKRVAAVAVDDALLKAAARRAVDAELRKESKPTRIGGFYVR